MAASGPALRVSASRRPCDLEPTAFGEKLARVGYQFEIDAVLHRDSDKVLPVIANRWARGDQVQILYLPDRDHDSVIISTA